MVSDNREERSASNRARTDYEDRETGPFFVGFWNLSKNVEFRRCKCRACIALKKRAISKTPRLKT